MERAGLEYVVECDRVADPVYVDRDMWEKIVLNLLSNAFKFTMEGRVSVNLKSLEDHVQLQITDTGIGVPKEEIPRLFERFHRVEGAKGRTQEGTGIGLALVQELVKIHHGTLEVTSEEGVGSTFTVTLPKGDNHLPQERIWATKRPASSAIRADSFVEEAVRWLPEQSETVADVVAPASLDSMIPETWGRISEGELIVVADDNAGHAGLLSPVAAGTLSRPHRIHYLAKRL